MSPKFELDKRTHSKPWRTYPKITIEPVLDAGDCECGAEASFMVSTVRIDKSTMKHPSTLACDVCLAHISRSSTSAVVAEMAEERVPA